MDNELIKLIEEQGYTYVGEKKKSLSAWDIDLMPYISGSIVYKDGFYGVLDTKTGKELTPCVHLSQEDAINDVQMINAILRDDSKKKLIGVQKILKDNLGEMYDPYTGSIVRVMFDILALPNSVKFVNDYYYNQVDEEGCIKVALRLYESVVKMIKEGGKRFTIYDYGLTNEFRDYCRSIERAVNGDLLYRVKHEYESLTPEEEKETDTDEFEEKYHKYIRIYPALYQYVELRKLNSNEMNIERTGWFHSKKPLIDIGPDETEYFEDSHDQNEVVALNREAFKEGVELEVPEESAG
jgi:hypothetical protein